MPVEVLAQSWRLVRVVRYSKCEGQVQGESTELLSSISNVKYCKKASSERYRPSFHENTIGNMVSFREHPISWSHPEHFSVFRTVLRGACRIEDCQSAWQIINSAWALARDYLNHLPTDNHISQNIESSSRNSAHIMITKAMLTSAYFIRIHKALKQLCLLRLIWPYHQQACRWHPVDFSMTSHLSESITHLHKYQWWLKKIASRFAHSVR